MDERAAHNKTDYIFFVAEARARRFRANGGVLVGSTAGY